MSCCNATSVQGRIGFATELSQSIGEADLVFLAVGTPTRRGDGHADLSFVFQAAEELAPHLDGLTVIATKSIVPVGTSREIERRLKARPENFPNLPMWEYRL
jgi:UDPglucose 6-dehydrogenase